MSERTTDTLSNEAETRSDSMTETTSDTIPPEPAEPTTTATNESILTGPGVAAATVPATPTRHRPIMATILAFGAGLLAVLSVYHLLQAIGIIPYSIGRLEIRAFSFFYAVMWGLMVWVWAWLVQMLWKVEPQAWIFLVVVSMFNLIFDFVLVLGDSTWSDVTASFMLNGLVLLYCMLPSTRRAFGR